MTDEIIKKINILRELVEEACHVIKACRIYIFFTDSNTPGRREVFKKIEDFDKKLTAEFTPKNISEET